MLNKKAIPPNFIMNGIKLKTVSLDPRFNPKIKNSLHQVTVSFLVFFVN